MKSEPSVYSIYHLQKSGKDLWDGVRNYQARNYMKNDMRVGDEVLFYHSNAKAAGVVGQARISGKARPDPTAFNPKSKYYDPTSTKKSPRWFCVEVSFHSIFPELITLTELRRQKPLAKMPLLKKGCRLSVMPISKKEYLHILSLTKKRNS